MKNLLLTSVFLSFCLWGFPQKDFFNFKETLRIDYLFEGNWKKDTLYTKSFYKYKFNHFNPNTAIDKFNYGNHKVEVFDSLSDVLIFSKGFNSIFEEWQSTAEAKTKTKSFQGSIIMPMPKRSFKFVISNKDKQNNYHIKHSSYINPNIAKSKNLPKNETYTIHKSGKAKDKFDIVIIPDGYGKNDSEKINLDAQKIADGILKCSPYSLLTDKINIHLVQVFSGKSGINDPTRKIKRESALKTTFNFFESERYLMTEEVWNMYDIAMLAPFDAILIMCNTDKYGGGGIYNLYATTCASCTEYAFITTHEMGHSVAGLADEYYTSDVSVEDYYNISVEPVEPNITTLVDFDSKWKNMLPEGTEIPTQIKANDNSLGVYEGAGYQAKGVYRPVPNCSMKDVIYNYFCPVCKRAIRETIEFYTK
ncbi:MAG: M64 family metallopeptidase [Bacteroidales bacterium]|jgi:hypothetical protein|nr:peptidase M64 [Bacteroidales bacterium]